MSPRAAAARGGGGGAASAWRRRRITTTTGVRGGEVRAGRNDDSGAVRPASKSPGRCSSQQSISPLYEERGHGQLPAFEVLLGGKELSGELGGVFVRPIDGSNDKGASRVAVAVKRLNQRGLQNSDRWRRRWRRRVWEWVVPAKVTKRLYEPQLVLRQLQVPWKNSDELLRSAPQVIEVVVQAKAPLDLCRR